MKKIKNINLMPDDFRKKWMLIFFSIFIIGIFSALTVSGYESYNESLERIERTHDNAVDVFKKKSLLAALYGYNKGMVDNQMSALYSAFPDIAYLAITDKNGNVFYEYTPKKKKEDVLKNINIEVFLNKEKRVEEHKNHYWYYGAPLYSKETRSAGFGNVIEDKVYQGSLIFVADGNPAVKEILDGYAISSIYVGFIIVFVYIVLRMFLNKMSSPILKIAALMDSASNGERDIKIDVNSQVKEVRTIQASFKKMMKEIVAREKELKSARDDALDFAKKKTEFTATISHEIKTPLNGIIGMLSAIDEKELEENTRESIKIARDSGDLLMNLVEDILNYSKLDAGHFALEHKEVDLESIINDTLLLQSKSHYGKDLSINGIYDKNLPKKFMTDRFRIKQLINNLVSNASKFTEDGYVYVNVYNNGEIKDNIQNVTIEVVDSGVGIGEEDYEKIFEAYSQKDNSMSRKYSGTGLGLAICKKIVEAMNGKISVESKIGVGSKFIIDLPLEIHSERIPYSGILSGKRIMAFTDSLDSEKLLESLADYSNMGVEYSDTIEAFEDKLKNQEYDLIFVSAQEHKLELEELFIDLKRHGFIQDKQIFNIKSFFVDDLYGADYNFSSPVSKSLYLQKLSSLFNNDIQTNIFDLSTVKKDIKTLRFNKKILIVEDNKINMKVAKKLLSKIGYENVDSAENGKIGYKKYKENNGYDLILMDCQMPVMDGFDSTKLIREYEKENKISACPIIALTANSSEEDKKQCFDAGMDYFMPKPIKRETVSETLYSIFENKIQKNHYL